MKRRGNKNEINRIQNSLKPEYHRQISRARENWESLVSSIQSTEAIGRLNYRLVKAGAHARSCDEYRREKCEPHHSKIVPSNCAHCSRDGGMA